MIILPLLLGDPAVGTVSRIGVTMTTIGTAVPKEVEATVHATEVMIKTDVSSL